MHTTAYTDIRNLIKEKAKAPRLEKKEDILKEYLEQKVSNGKKQLCRFFIRGMCIFSAEECRFAHGVKDLIFDAPPLEPYLEKLRTTKEEDWGKINELFCEKKTKEQKRREQPTLDLEKTYKNLFDYQPRMIQLEELEKPFTQEEIDNDTKIRGLVRDVFQREMQQGLTHTFFNHYQAKFLPKGFVELCFQKVEWYPKFRKIINSHCCYEVQHPTYGPVILRLPRKAAFDEIIEDCLVTLFKEYDLLKQIPIKSSHIQELYKNLMAKDIFLPHLNHYIYRHRNQLDDILQNFQNKPELVAETQNKPSFFKKLADALDIREEDLVGKKLFEHEKDTNIKQRNDIIEAYQTKQVVNGKAELCRFFMRGLCIFGAKECKFAHGITDLQFEKVDIEPFDKKFSDHKKDQEYKEWEKNWVDILKERQPSLNLEFSYKDLYSYQFKLLEQGLITNTFTQKELDDEDDNRRDIRVFMHVEMTKQFMEVLFEVYGRKYLKRTFVDKCFQSIGWMTNWNRILDGEYCYEVKVPNVGCVIMKIPPIEELHSFMEDCVVKIIKDNGLLNCLPIASTTISKYFYKDLVPNDPYMPTLQIYLKKTKKTIEEFLLALQRETQFIAKLSKECNKNEKELKELVLFDSSATELKELMQKMKKILHEMIEKSNIGFILFSRYEETIAKRCTKEVARFNTNLGFLRRLMKGVAMALGVLIINLLSEDYLFSVQKLKSVDAGAISKKYTAKLNLKCKKREIKHHHTTQYPLVIKDSEEKPEEKIKEDNLDQEIDVRKIRVIDNEESLNEAKQFISHHSILAIDLEGNLNRNGLIELIQVGCGDMIFIFDIYKVKYIETSQTLYTSLAAYVKEIMENSKICKIFHDCRKDSLALHLFMNCCPVNVFDVSAMHTLIEHLEIYSSFKDDLIFSKDEECKINEAEEAVFNSKFEKGLEIMTCVEGIKPPGLNEILKAYGASHGINHLKAIMKKKFEEMPREYFLKRPLEKEFLIYSAKDVEDLIEVKGNIEEKLLKVLNKMAGFDNKQAAEFLWKKVSKTYVLFGCTNSSIE